MEETPSGRDPFRGVYVHGWQFALKGIALAYHRARIDDLAPLAAALGAADTGKTEEEAFHAAVARGRLSSIREPEVSVEQLRARLTEIDWLRYRKHWIAITGAKLKDGKHRRTKLKSTGDQEKVLGLAQNTAASINAVADKIMSPSWRDLTSDVDA